MGIFVAAPFAKARSCRTRISALGAEPAKNTQFGFKARNVSNDGKFSPLDQRITLPFFSWTRRMNSVARYLEYTGFSESSTIQKVEAPLPRANFAASSACRSSVGGSRKT